MCFHTLPPHKPSLVVLNSRHELMEWGNLITKTFQIIFDICLSQY